MFGLDPATFSAAYLLAAAVSCPAAPPPPVVELELQQSAPPVLENLGVAELTEIMKPHPTGGALDATVAQERWLTAGLTEGRMMTRYAVQFAVKRAGNITCFAPEKIHYDIIYAPVIHIASDLLNKDCTRPVVLAHEQSHVAADLQTIRDYFPTMRAHIALYAGTIGVLGPYQESAAIDAEKRRVTDAVMAASVPVWNALSELRRERQAEIDTVENYRRAQASCPGPWIPNQAP